MKTTHKQNLIAVALACYDGREVGKDAADADHFIDHEERLRVMMARQ